MNDNESILAGLRKIAAWADMRRRMTKWSLVVLAVLVPGMIVLGVLTERRVRTTIEDIGAPQRPDWYDVEQNVRLGDFEKATRIGEELIAKTSQNPDAHRRLAAVYLAAGRIEKAREHYAEAVRLFPSEENEKELMAIDKRIKAQNAQPDGPASAASPRR